MVKMSFKDHHGFSKTNKYFRKLIELKERIDLNKYGIRGVAALAAATPKDSGETALSWRYRIVHGKGRSRVEWYNTNKTDQGVPIAILLQYGHATKNGSWVEGHDYINPTLKPIFDQMAQEIWYEVNNV